MYLLKKKEKEPEERSRASSCVCTRNKNRIVKDTWVQMILDCSDSSKEIPSLQSVLVDIEIPSTFREINVGDFVGGPSRVAEVLDQFLDRVVARCDQIDRFHGRQGLSLLIDVFYQGDSLSADIVHFAARRHHPHG